MKIILVIEGLPGVGPSSPVPFKICCCYAFYPQKHQLTGQQQRKRIREGTERKSTKKSRLFNKLH